MTTSVATLLLLLLAAPAKVSKVDSGQRLFNAGELDAALKVLDQAAQEGGDEATLERVHLLRAQCFAAKQDFSRAEEAFALALEANPDTSLDPGRVDPTVVKMLEGVRARLTGAVLVRSTPPGASLFLDGKNAGEAPQTLAVPVGRHKLEARWGEGPMTAMELQIRPRRDVRVEWVQGAGGPGEAPKGRPVRPFGDIRGTLEIPSVPAGVTGGLDLGGGFEVSWFRFGLWARVYPYFGVAPRAAFFVPVMEQVSVFLELEVPLWFRGGGVAVGFGGAGGAEFMPLRWLGLFGQIGGQHLFVNPVRNDDTHFIATAGVRLRMP